MTVRLPERKRTRCAHCGQRRVCWTVKRPGIVAYLCDWCIFDVLARHEEAS